jgi:hypothetical protein
MIKNKGGRPTDFTEELGKEICHKLAITPVGLGTLCKQNPHWPARQTIHEWRLKHKEFADNYAKAKAAQIEILVEECFEIADDTSYDTIQTESGNEVCNTEYVNRSRLRIDIRKWYASKLAPKIYGDKTDHKHDITIRQEDALKELE